MGEVYSAKHALLQRPTAVKLIRPDQQGEHNLARFEREVQLTSQLTHPNTIAIFDFGRTPDGTFYYAMEYLGGGLDLETLVAEAGPVPAPRVVHILEQVCASLSEAHSHGMVHRDIKPANIILCERGGVRDFVKVIDFGLVKNLVRASEDGDPALTAANAITGSPLFMSPEAIRSSDSVGPQSDIYGVGAVGYFLLTGQQLFDSRNVIEVCGLQMSKMPVPPSERLGRKVPEDLESVILACLAKEPGERPQGASGVLARLVACSDHGVWTAEDATAWWDGRQGAGKQTRQRCKPVDPVSDVAETLPS
jgi:serine/threonine-protein kinase